MLNIGILGCGVISSHYLKGSTKIFDKNIRVVACADMLLERAQARAEEYGVPKALTTEQLLADPEVDLIVNLTVPQVHFELSKKILEAGKHLYTEKPFALNREEAAILVETAKKHGVRIGCAPDTFMNGPLQTGKKIIEDGIIGDIVGVNCCCPMRGNEFHRPDADFFYKKGAGPIWDMAPYYLNMLISLFGSIKTVTSVGRITWPQRVYEYESRKGDTIDVEVPTHTVGLFEMENGAIVSFTDSFDMYKSSIPKIEIYGQYGTLILADPNMYKGDVKLSIKKGPFEDVPHLEGYEGFMRSAGIADMAVSIEKGVPHLASAEMALHVTDVMCTWEEAMESRRTMEVKSSCAQPEGMWLRAPIR